MLTLETLILILDQLTFKQIQALEDLLVVLEQHPCDDVVHELPFVLREFGDSLGEEK